MAKNSDEGKLPRVANLIIKSLCVWSQAASGGIVPLEHPDIDPALARGTIGLVTALGFTGGFVSPIIGKFVSEKVGGQQLLSFGAPAIWLRQSLCRNGEG